MGFLVSGFVHLASSFQGSSCCSLCQGYVFALGFVFIAWCYSIVYILFQIPHNIPHLIIHSRVGGCWSYVHIGATVSKVAMDTPVQAFVWTPVSRSLVRTHLGVVWLRHDELWASLLGNHPAAPFAFSLWGFWSLHSSTHTRYDVFSSGVVLVGVV